MKREMSVDFLTGLAVLELGDGLAGGAAGSLLRTLGANVTAIRRPSAIIHRLRPAARANASDSMVSVVLAAGKRSVPSGTRVDVQAFDIVLEDLCESAADPNEGVTWEEFASSGHPNAWVTISAFGATGPKRDWTATDLTVAAASGLLAGVTDPVTGRPVKMAGYQAYHSAGQAAALAACHALDASGRRGCSVRVDVSAQEAAIATGAVLHLAQELMSCGEAGGAARFGAPAGMFRCRDGFIHIMAMEDHQWQALVGAIGAPPWTVEFRHPADRITRASEVNVHLERHLATWGKAEIEAKLQAARVPATAMYGPSELVRSAQFEARRAFGAITNEGAPVRAVRTPFKIDRSPDRIDRSPLGLVGLRVAEIGHVLAVPLAGALLGAMGAEVTKLEDPGRLDMYRRRGPYVEGMSGVEGSAYFAVMNHSKTSALVIMDDPLSVAAAIDTADVVIENLGAQRARRVGVDSDRLLQERPASLAVSSSGFGHTGPWSAFRVYAYNVHTCCGLAYLTPTDSGEPPRIDVAWADLISGFALTTAIAAWAICGSRTGGAAVDFSMVELAVTRFNEYLAAASLGDDIGVGECAPVEHPGPYAPQGVYRTAGDGEWVALSLSCDDQWAGLKSVLGEPALLCSPAFDTTAGRTEHRKQLNAALDDVLVAFRAEEVERLLQGVGVAASVVASPAALAVDAHLVHRGFFRSVKHPLWGRRRLIGLPWRFEGEEPFSLGPPPRLGEGGSFMPDLR